MDQEEYDFSSGDPASESRCGRVCLCMDFYTFFSKLRSFVQLDLNFVLKALRPLSRGLMN